MNLFRKVFILFFVAEISSAVAGGNKKLDSLFTKLNSARNDSSKAWLLNLIGEEYFNFNGDSAMIFWDKAEKFSEEKIRSSEGKELLSYKRTLAEVYNSKGAYYMQTGDEKKTIDFWQRSIDIRKETNDKYGVCLSLINMGFVFYQREDYPKTAELWTQAERLATEIKNLPLIAHSRNSLGGLYHSMGEIEKASDYFKALLDFKLKNNIDDDLGTVYANLATLASEKNDYNTAFIYIRKAIAFDTKTNNVFSLGKYYDFIGTMMLDKKQYDSAFVYLGMSEKIYSTGNFVKELAHNNLLFARACYELGDYKKTKEYALKAFETGRAVNSKSLMKDAASHLRNVFSKEKDFENAYKYFTIYTNLKDSIQIKNDKSSALKKQLLFDYEKEKLEMKKEQEKAEMAAADENEKQRVVILSIGGGFLLLAVFSFLLFNRFRLISRQKNIIDLQRKEMQHQKEIVEEKNKEIVDSINYAKRIQYALLANKNLVDEILAENFIFFRPKDIVSGDFYWAAKKEDRFYLAVCDSTGHGVPGAFMCLLNISFLNEATNEKNIQSPDQIFNYIRKRLIENVSQDGAQDGMDGILVCFALEENKLKNITYTAANNAPLLITNSEMNVLPCDKMPVGKGEKNKDFSLHIVPFEKGSSLFLCTDGYADQFGGPKGKKFKYKQLNEKLVSMEKLSAKDQNKELESAFTNWKGQLEQVDDVLIMGIKC